MYANLLMPTDGSEVAGKAIQHGIALAMRIGAKATVLTVLPPFHILTTDTQMIKDTLVQYKARMQEQAEKALCAVARAAQAAGVACETVQTALAVMLLADDAAEAFAILRRHADPRPEAGDGVAI
jgi:nucleotide-binding universal stress UspA family protein